MESDETSGAHPPPSAFDRRAAALAHAAVLLVFFLPLGNVAGPWAVHAAAARRSPFAAAHAEQSLLFQALVSLVAWSLFLLGRMHGFLPGIHLLVLMAGVGPALWAAVRALQGRAFQYPFPGRRVSAFGLPEGETASRRRRPSA
jgi:uncharacterized Tic20 family protein